MWLIYFKERTCYLFQGEQVCFLKEVLDNSSFSVNLIEIQCFQPFCLRPLHIPDRMHFVPYDPIYLDSVFQ